MMSDRFSMSARNSLAEMVYHLKKAEELDGKTLNSAKTVLFVVDMNNGFAKKGALYSDRTENMIEPIRDFALQCQKQGMRIVAFSDCHSTNSPEFTGYPPHCVEGTQECELVDELAFLKDNVIYKSSTNGLFCDLDEILNGDYTNFILVGCCTDICIYQLAVGLKAYFNQKNMSSSVIVPMELVDTFDSPDHNADLYNVVFCSSMVQNGITVVRKVLF